MSTLHRNDRSPSAGVSESSSPDFTSHTPRSSSKQQVRHRASVACASCRERRIRCVVPEGESGCTQCKKTGAECIIRNDDERRRPISKAYMSSLSSRITLLEKMLRERGVAPPPAVHPPKTRQEAKEMQEHEKHDVRFCEDFETPGPNQANSSMVADYPSPPKFSAEEVQTDPIDDNKQTLKAPSYDSTLFPEFASPWKGDVRQFLGVKSRFSVMSGRLQYFGFTASSHVHAQNTSQPSPPGTIDHASRVERVINILGPSTHDHLMSCFWGHYNPAVQVVDREIFELGRKSQNPRHYSVFLHITMLAAGYRFSERNREDLKRLMLGSWESTFHRESKSMLDAELERPGGIPSIQALLILADLEFAAGRDATGWLYSGMANRLAIDIGLHVNVPVSDSEVLRAEEPLRRRVMTACVLFDRYWALLLGRSPSIRNRDIGIELGLKPRKGPAKSTASPTTPFDMVTSQSPEISLHQHLLELMSIAAKILEMQNQHEYTELLFANNKAGEEAYQRLFALDRKLQAWYRRLPDFLAWNPANVQAAPVGFFMLHQQFHTCMILLHRPWAIYGDEDGSNSTRSYGQSGGSLPGISHHHRVAVARRMCTQHAIRVARIFWHHRLRFDSRRLPIFAIQQAGTSAIALMAALANRTAELDQQSNLRYLQVLSAAIYDMCYIYQPAARMYRLLKSMLVDIRNEVVTGVSYPHAQSKTSPEVTVSAPPPFLQYTHQRSYSTPNVGLNFGAPDWATRGSISSSGGDTHGCPQFSGRQQPENDLFEEHGHPPPKRQRCNGPSRRASDLGGSLPPSFFNTGGFGGTSSYPTPPLTSPRDSGDVQAKGDNMPIPDTYNDNSALFDFVFLEATALDTVMEEPSEEQQQGVEESNQEDAETDSVSRAASTPTVSSHSHKEGSDTAEETADILLASGTDANRTATEDSSDSGRPKNDPGKASSEATQDSKVSVSVPAPFTASAQEEDSDSNIIEEWLAEPLPPIAVTSNASKTINPAALTSIPNTTMAPMPTPTTTSHHHLARFQQITHPHQREQQSPNAPPYKRDARVTKQDHPDLFPKFDKSAIIDALVSAAGINFDLSLCREVDVEDDGNYDHEHDDVDVVNEHDFVREYQGGAAGGGKDGCAKGGGEGPSGGSAAYGVGLSDLLGSMGGGGHRGNKRRIKEVEGSYGAGLGCGYATATSAAKLARNVELDYLRF
ncbi:fungal-specific transcription factor domain-containing protein [Neurospora hispaniola]|uniref:Fungal-specific transcription factor domain-containing protein n=1 Tax=Neurospora hispaniola TaxID=588809 RepID=A0AAJ0HYB2_9PEZI|nr:fungal-specific transcription factor domain-containing protein [Neurospora hispaniola]